MDSVTNFKNMNFFYITVKMLKFKMLIVGDVLVSTYHVIPKYGENILLITGP